VSQVGADAGRVAALRGDGVEVWEHTFPGPVESVRGLLLELGRRRMTNLLVEGGAAVLGSFLDAGVIDEAHVFLAPRLAGGAAAKTPIGGRGVDRVAEALRLDELSVELVEGDLLIRGRRLAP
jgi:diaminohydroxyphosphoribosylaminopyrimidine deaminase/5-amino-6-(5-phosphoribosylamino)uracil reductase